LPLIELYNWQTQAWEIIAINQWGSYAVPEAGRFVDREGAIRLRVEVVDSASHFEIDALEVALQVRLAR
jgi:hypothetical protein